jgi:hypothetical protein
VQAGVLTVFGKRSQEGGTVVRQQSEVENERVEPLPRSEIRSSTIDELLEKVRNHNYGQVSS